MGGRDARGPQVCGLGSGHLSVVSLFVVALGVVSALGGLYSRDGCWCTHVCFIHASLKASPKARLIDVPRAYLFASR